MIADPHCPNAMGVGWTECSVMVAHQVTWCFVPRKGVGYLTGEPRGGRIGSHIDRDQPPAGVTQDHQAVEQLERDRAYDEQIQRSDASDGRRRHTNSKRSMFHSLTRVGDLRRRTTSCWRRRRFSAPSRARLVNQVMPRKQGEFRFSETLDAPPPKSSLRSRSKALKA